MREGRRLRTQGLLLATFLLVLLSVVTGPSAEAASPEASPPSMPSSIGQNASPSPSIIGIGDSRSSGEGPGLVGSPFAILVGVVLLGVIAAGGTAAYLRWTRPNQSGG